MRGQILQGESKEAAIYINDSTGESIDPAIWSDMEVYLVESSTYKTLSKFSRLNKPGGDFLPITFDTYIDIETGEETPYALIRFFETKDIPIGNIDIQIHLIQHKAATGEKDVTIWKGKLARMVRTKRN